MQKIYALLKQTADLDVNLLISGDSGTGKELIAEAIHLTGSRTDKPLIKVNCAALSESLLEGELFGHVRGAFTGAVKDRIGRCQAAEGGTLFLDEIGGVLLFGLLLGLWNEQIRRQRKKLQKSEGKYRALVESLQEEYFFYSHDQHKTITYIISMTKDAGEVKDFRNKKEELEDFMRRKEKEIKELGQISHVIKKCKVCRLGLSQNDVPYIVPVSFGYDGQTLFFHSAKSGKKIDILSVNNKVCFEFESGVEIVTNENMPCNWSCSFQSVIGFGRVHELSSPEDKIRGLTQIMAQYSDKEWNFDTIPLKGFRVWKIIIESITGKQSMDHVDQ